MERIHILGVPVDKVTRRSALERLVQLLRSDGQSHVATPNPEMIVAAKSDPAFLSILRSTVLNLPDGVGLLWAARFLGHALSERVTGTDMMRELCRLKDGPNIFLLGALPGVAEDAAAVLRRENPAVRIVGTYAGSPAVDQEDSIVAMINDCQPALLFVAYGAPAQERWIARNLSRMSSVRLAMGVGGAFDFISDRKSRAPVVMRTFGLEWAWRLLQEPKRIGRIINAVVVFPILVIFRSR